MKLHNISEMIDKTIHNEVKKKILSESESKEYYHVIQDGQPIETFEKYEDAEQYVMDNEEKGKKLLIDKKKYDSYESMINALDEMGDNLDNNNNTMKKKIKESFENEDFDIDEYMSDINEYDIDEPYVDTSSSDLYSEDDDVESIIPSGFDETLDRYLGQGSDMREYDTSNEEYQTDEELYELDLGEDMSEGGEMCSECGNMLNEDGSCDECSSKVYETDDSRFSDDYSRLPNTESEQICQECGNRLNENDMCSECGYTQEETKEGRGDHEDTMNQMLGLFGSEEKKNTSSAHKDTMKSLERLFDLEGDKKSEKKGDSILSKIKKYLGKKGEAQEGESYHESYDVNEEDLDIDEDHPDAYGDWHLDRFEDEFLPDRGENPIYQPVSKIPRTDIERIQKKLNPEYKEDEFDKPYTSLRRQEEFELRESKKRKIVLSEKQMTQLIKQIVLESIPGKKTAEKSRKESGKDTKNYYSDVEQKMKKYLKFEGNDNPKFPHQIGKGEKVARKNTPQQNDEIEKNFAGLESLKYDVEPSENFKKRLKMAIEGDSTMGNAVYTGKNTNKPSNSTKKAKDAEQKIGNQIDNKETEKKLNKRASNRVDKSDRVLYKKEKVPVDTSNKKSINESVIKNEIDKIKRLYKYNDKTQ